MRLALLALALVAACGGGPNERPRVRLATTTSTENSGLLGYLLPAFEKEHGIEVQVIAVGTGQALKLGERGDADLVLVHARAAEEAFMAAGHGSERRDVWWNDFVLLGPEEDPAGVKGTDAAAALRTIAAKRALFVSRGDNSGTHKRELELWKAAGLAVPRGERHYLDAGQGMGKCLVIADEKRAYVLTDRGTYLAFRKKLDLAVLVENDRSLHNPYGAMIVNPARHRINHEGASRLLRFFTSPATQKRVAAFRVDGQVLFHPAIPE